MFTRYFRMVWVCVVLVAMQQAVGADVRQPQEGRLELSTERVVVFKDGHALFVRRGSGTADARGRLYTHQVPDAAVLGTVWAFSDRHQILGTRSEFDRKWRPHREPADAKPMSVAAMITRSVGKSVTLHLRDDRLMEGTLHKLMQVDGAAFVIVEAPAEPTPVMIELDQILSVSADHLAEGEPQLKPTKRMTFLLGEAAAHEPVELTLMYFGPGIRWIPTYRVAGALIDDARVSLQAELLNEVEDLRGVTLDLVAGVPNFRFKDTISPLSLERVLRHTLQQVAPQLMSQRAGFQSRAGEQLRLPDAGRMELGPDLPDDQQELHVYRIEDFDLTRGGRASALLWDGRVPLSHVYSFDAHLARRGSELQVVQERPEHVDGLPDQPLVWHKLELTNTADLPWTTGAALILREALPMGQDLLRYTPAGSRAHLPVTVAVNVLARVEEEEIEREQTNLRWANRTLTRIHKRGEVRLANHRKSPVPLRVHIATGGRAENLSDEGRVRLHEYRPGDWRDNNLKIPRNQHSEMFWDIELDPGETHTFTYELSFYTR